MKLLTTASGKKEEMSHLSKRVRHALFVQCLEKAFYLRVEEKELLFEMFAFWCNTGIDILDKLVNCTLNINKGHGMKNKRDLLLKLSDSREFSFSIEPVYEKNPKESITRIKIRAVRWPCKLRVNTFSCNYLREVCIENDDFQCEYFSLHVCKSGLNCRWLVSDTSSQRPWTPRSSHFLY